MAGDPEVRNNPDRSRYELVRDGRVIGVADYRPSGDVVVFPHTEIESSLRGHGLGAVLVRGALDDMARQGKTVIPQCWYVADFIDEHPEYAGLVATPA